MHKPGRGDGALRRYRIPLPETSYFLTLCSADRFVGLNQKTTAQAIQAEIAAIEADGHWTQRVGTIMPDHLHLLAHTTGQLPIARCVARLKSKTRTTLLAHGPSWQPNFY
jgi:REP element-mobilizing transposase RayT